jgi:CHAT domain-containing protein/tetratricopeptide (TPR) repeat protein
LTIDSRSVRTTIVKARAARLAFGGGLLLFFLSSPSHSCGTAGSPAVLKPGAATTRELKGAERQFYQLALGAREYARTEVVQEGIDLKIRISDPKGNPITDVDNLDGRFSTERFSLLSDAPEIYCLEIDGPANPEATGTYQIRVVEVRGATPADALRVSAERREERADQIYNQRSTGGLRDAPGAYLQALEAWQAAGDTLKQAEMRYRLGSVRRLLGDNPQALQELGAALDLLRQTPDERLAPLAYNQIGLVHWAMAENPAALTAFQAALARWRSLGDAAQEAAVLNNLGSLHQAQGELREAMDDYSQALQIFQREKDVRHEGLVLINLGSIHFSLGEPGAARQTLDQALVKLRKEGERSGVAEALNYRGLLADQLGDGQAALDFLTEALSIFEALGNRRQQASVLINLGSQYAELGEPGKATGFFSRALELQRAIGDRRGEAATLVHLGEADSALGKSDQGRECFEQAAGIQRAIGDRVGEAASLLALGTDQIANRPADAVETLQRALDRYSELSLPAGRARSAERLGAAQAALGETAKAVESLKTALQVATAVQDPPLEADSLQELARIELARGDPAAALARIEPALQIIESLRGQVAADRLRTSYFASWRDAYDLAVEALMSLHAAHPDAGYDARAFQVAERARARGLLDLLREGKVEVHAGADPGLLAKEEELRVAIRAKSERESRLQSEGAAPDPIDEARKEVEALLSDYELLDGRLRAASPRYADLTRPPEVRLADVQRLLGADSALLEISLGTPRSWAWLVTGDSLSSYELPPQGALTEMAKRAYAALSAPASRTAPRADVAELGRLLLGPAVDRLEGRRLAVVAAGALQYIPFAALPDPRTGEPLIESREVVSLPSAAVLAELRRTAAGRPRPTLDLAVLADPVFSAADPRLALARKAPTAPLLKLAALNPELERSARDVGTPGVEVFERLSWTRREAEGIAGIAAGAGPLRVLTALDFEASRETATGPAVAGARVVHFATHGFLDSETPELSGLVLSLVDRNGNPTDGFLRLHDVYGLTLAADLVVLSGCRTALGKEVKGEGLLGLTRGFLYAGAPRVMASLWPVRDRATAELMQRFYRGVLHDGLPPAAALRAAQRSLRRDPRWRDPFYWAPFILQGDWLAAPR